MISRSWTRIGGNLRDVTIMILRSYGVGGLAECGASSKSTVANCTTSAPRADHPKSTVSSTSTFYLPPTGLAPAQQPGDPCPNPILNMAHRATDGLGATIHHGNS